MTDVASLTGFVEGPGGYYNPADRSGPYAINSNGVFTLIRSSGVGAPFRLPSALASTNANVVKNSSGQVYKIRGVNLSAGTRRIKFYNTASVPVPGTTPVFDSFGVPAGTSFAFDVMDLGWYFSAGIAFALLQGSADSDTTAVAAGDITDLSVLYS